MSGWELAVSDDAPRLERGGGRQNINRLSSFSILLFKTVADKPRISSRAPPTTQKTQFLPSFLPSFLEASPKIKAQRGGGGKRKANTFFPVDVPESSLRRKTVYYCHEGEIHTTISDETLDYILQYITVLHVEKPKKGGCINNVSTQKFWENSSSSSENAIMNCSAAAN